MKKDDKKLLNDNLSQLEDLRKWLTHSLEKCKKIGVKDNYSVDELDQWEVFSSRFGRTVDFLIRKAFRSLDVYELEDGGTLIDAINRAHKRGLIHSTDELRAIKELRNLMAHEYTRVELQTVFSAVLKQSPVLLDIIQKTIAYCEKH